MLGVPSTHAMAQLLTQPLAATAHISTRDATADQDKPRTEHWCGMTVLAAAGVAVGPPTSDLIWAATPL